MKNPEKFIKFWAQERKKGKVKFILIRGTLVGISGSIGCIIGINIGSLIMNKGLLFLPYWYYLCLFLLCCAGGYAGSEIQWDRSEEKYNKLLDNKKFD